MASVAPSLVNPVDPYELSLKSKDEDNDDNEHGSGSPFHVPACLDENVSVTPTIDHLSSSRLPTPQTATPFRATLPATPSAQSTSKLPYPTPNAHIDPMVVSDNGAKVPNDLPALSSRRPVLLDTPRADYSPRRERRLKLKHNEIQGRLPLLSLSPASVDVLNVVQTPSREQDNKLLFSQNPVRKAQRIPILTLSHRSPVKPLGLLRFPSPVKLDDPNRIPARRIPNLNSPLRTSQSIEALMHSPPRRIPILKGDQEVLGSAASGVTKETCASTSSPPFGSSGHSFEPSAKRLPGELIGSVTSPQKALDLSRSSNAVKTGFSKLPVLSSRPISNHSSLLPVRKKINSATTLVSQSPAIFLYFAEVMQPSRIPSPIKRDIDVKASIISPNSLESRSEHPGSKRKRVENESDNESDERPHKRPISEAQSTFKEVETSSWLEPSGMTGMSIQKTVEPTIHGPRERDTDPMVVENIATGGSVLSPKMKSMNLPGNSSTLSFTLNPNPKRTSRVRKPPAIPQSQRSRVSTRSSARSIPSQKECVPIWPSKSPSRPPSRSAARESNFDRYPDNPRQLQWLTSVNTQHNQEPLSELERQVIRRSGNRPPSPSGKFRIDANKSREEREARAERRQRREKGHDALVPDTTQCFETIIPSSESIYQTKHMRAPGDDEDYETPVKPCNTTSERDRMTKMVKWSKHLVDSTKTSTSNSVEQPVTSKAKLKSCFLREPSVSGIS